ncbi:Amine oxidase [Dillenia turbinata]|uniref:Amine oxidase n=1 Tax=Dillenia turbinata TaxID=194707 RepID=A0AAN8UPQ4_9MAGN
MMLASCLGVKPYFSSGTKNGFCCRASDKQIHIDGLRNNDRKKVVVVGSGWAGLGAAHHLSKQGFNVTVIADATDDAGIRGFFYPFRNIFSLVDELGIKPFTEWTKSAQYSGDGLEVEFPIFQDQPQLPTPFGTLLYAQFIRLPVLDRLTSLPLMAACKSSVVLQQLWECCIILYSGTRFDRLILSHEAAEYNGNKIRHTISIEREGFRYAIVPWDCKREIFNPWMGALREKGCQVMDGETVTDLIFDEETGQISEVACSKKLYKADAVILAVGISTLQEIIKSRQEFLKVMNLAGIDVLSVKLQINRRVQIPNASNACTYLDDSSGWTFFDLSNLDVHKDDPVTALQADFYYANELLLLSDELIIAKVMTYLSKVHQDFENVAVTNKVVGRYPKSLSHFFPGFCHLKWSLALKFTSPFHFCPTGSYKFMMRGSTSFPNLFMGGDWIVTRHGSWLQEKSYVTGLEAANRVVDFLEEGSFAKIIPVEEDEPHIQVLRSLNRNLNRILDELPWSKYFLQ